MAFSAVGLHTVKPCQYQTTVCNITFFSPQAATKKQKYEKISEKKMSTPVEVLCKVCENLHSVKHT